MIYLFSKEVNDELKYYKPMPLWYKYKKFMTDEDEGIYRETLWKNFIKSQKYFKYLKNRLIFEMKIIQKLNSYHSTYFMILSKISEAFNISINMFANNTMSYLM